MKGSGNGTPETCASNLLRIVRGEVPFDRVRGRDGSLVDCLNAQDRAAADAEWLLTEYEPRVVIESVTAETADEDEAASGNFELAVKVRRKEQTESG